MTAYVSEMYVKTIISSDSFQQSNRGFCTPAMEKINFGPLKRILPAMRKQPAPARVTVLKTGTPPLRQRPEINRIIFASLGT